MDRATAGHFAEYAAAAGTGLGDRVAQWLTLNEPVSVTLNGYALGVHAPDRDLLFNALPSVHHQLLGHGRYPTTCFGLPVAADHLSILLREPRTGMGRLAGRVHHRERRKLSGARECHRSHSGLKAHRISGPPLGPGSEVRGRAYWFLFARLIRLARSISWRKCFFAQTTPTTTAATTSRNISQPMMFLSLASTNPIRPARCPLTGTADTKTAPLRVAAGLFSNITSGRQPAFRSAISKSYLMILVTRPEPTVRPPSRIAKPRPSSIAIGWMSATVISVLSPGITISVPSGRVITPVTSVVRK